MSNILELRDVQTFIGRFHILEGVSLDVPEGEIVALLGRNGAGKTTTLKTILGLTPASSGTVVFDGTDIAGMRPFDIAAMGIGYVPEHRAIFADLSVEENLRIAERRKGDLDRNEELIFGLFPDLKRFLHLPGTSLSGEEPRTAVSRYAVCERALFIWGFLRAYRGAKPPSCAWSQADSCCILARASDSISCLPIVMTSSTVRSPTTSRMTDSET